MTLDVRSLTELAACAALGLVSAACTCSSDDSAKQVAAQSAAPPARSSPPPVIASSQIPLDRVIRLPSGPVLEILPGQGVGAIRLGATVATIERLMGAPCELKTDKACRYVGRAVEFFLDDQGVTNEIRIHRVDRPATPEGRTFGVFNGRMQNGLTLMMIPNGVRGLIGNPQKVEEVKDGGPNHTVEVDYYDGMRIEYDKLPPDRTVVGGIIITKGTKPFASPPAASHPRPTPLH
jgi:hypothetical protein